MVADGSQNWNSMITSLEFLSDFNWHTYIFVLCMLIYVYVHDDIALIINWNAILYAIVVAFVILLTCYDDLDIAYTIVINTLHLCCELSIPSFSKVLNSNLRCSALDKLSKMHTYFPHSLPKEIGCAA